MPVISSSVANTPCINLGVPGLLKKLNTIFGTSYILDNPSLPCHIFLERRDVATPINGDEWPVPVTKDVNFDLIRIEMVNAGAERAWTLQETYEAPTIGRKTGEDGFMEEEIQARLQGWHAFSGERGIPAYDERQSEEDAWIALVAVMSLCMWEELFFRYPQAGDRSKIWRPSWRQVMNEVLLSANPRWLGRITRSEEGLDIGSSEGNRRQGELLVVEDHSGAKHTFKFVAEYQYPIPE
ncbi:uncharacterized protein BT62DRAFT_923003 [Guyanagaster necrorhizus]|uniref:Uncharacterized protein n=1 Tax=Guyanagaster necrorhizus TaxID=856835 RepID=A0A9P7VL70_9AGAR|nr:uncharacterized protein BT62DRAFT_923003 [Guyanagaster necrorhizus MCA 3950]KAG7442001.1 hypothetical protein BT62DRAFT_923003 [Guyanagaster necrorhizus MCA 3950]